MFDILIIIGKYFYYKSVFISVDFVFGLDMFREKELCFGKYRKIWCCKFMAQAICSEVIEWLWSSFRVLADKMIWLGYTWNFVT